MAGQMSQRQKEMTSSWDTNVGDRKYQLEIVNSAYKSRVDEINGTIKKAQEAIKLAKHAKPQDTQSIDEAKSIIEQAIQERAEAKRERDTEVNRINGEYGTTHDTLRNIERSHNSTLRDTMVQDTKKAAEDIKRSVGSIISTGEIPEDIKNDMSESKTKSKFKAPDMKFSESFYRDVSSAIRGKPQGNEFDSSAKTAKALAQDFRNEAGTHQMEAQQSQQIADQNPYTEAGKVATVTNDAENRQTINNTSFAAGTAAARLRKTNAPDVQAQMNREDQQRVLANERRDMQQVAQAEATGKEGQADMDAVTSRNFDDFTDRAAALSKGSTAKAWDKFTESDGTAEPEPTQTAEPRIGNWTLSDVQNAVNIAELAPNRAKELYTKRGGTDWENDAVRLQPLVDELKSGNKQPYYNFLDNARDGKALSVDDNTKLLAGKGGMAYGTDDTTSDARVKNLKACLSDLHMKFIKEDFDKYGRCSPEQFDWLLHRAGNLKHDGKEYDIFGSDDFSNDMTILNAYKDHIRNYVYNYKPEAVEVDASIDPNEEHIGPMAQDIEQVNPACVKETPEGVKTVDTARLAMMNAGAIGDLARQLNELNEKFKALGL